MHAPISRKHLALPRPAADAHAADGLRPLGPERASALARVGIRSLGALLEHEAVRAARLLRAVARGGLPAEAAEGLVRGDYGERDLTEAVAWPLAALGALDEARARPLAAAGVSTIDDLARLADEAGEAVLAAQQDNGFYERPSAPAPLLPTMIGSVASSVRFTSFVRDRELRGLAFKVDEACAVPLPISSVYTKHSGSITDIFTGLRCPVVHLGYLCDHRQRWTNLGTHLGEVVHSISLAPGESRNIALVNWRRRQLTALEEHTTTSERLTATFVQNRALKEITSAVAREHQAGRTRTEANTSVTAASFVGAGGVVGGIAGGVGGAVVGGLSGLAVDVLLMGTDAGAGTIAGTVGGAAGGAALGGAAGMAAGGLVYSGAQALGVIEADTEGDREIVADVHQRITLSTSQAASVVRSLWSTVVVEDAQAEHVEVQTSNVTNYNHMHALNLEYYEVLQHYLARVTLEGVQPILFLPFTFFDFTHLRFVRDYWEAVRPHLNDEGLQAQGDAYFVTEGPPESPDLLPVPPMPTAPGTPALSITGLEIDVIFQAAEGVGGTLLNLVSDLDLEVLRGSSSVLPAPIDGAPITQGLNADEKGKRFTFPDIPHAAGVSGVRLTRSQAWNTDITYRVRVRKGTLRRDGDAVDSLDGRNVVTNGTIAADDDGLTYDRAWTPAASALAASAEATAQYNAAVAARNEVLAENERRTAAYETLVENLQRFEERLQRLILRRRHFFTRVILDSLEPEEIRQLLEAVQISHEAAADGFGLPLSAVADTLPLGLTGGAFVLRLKRLTPERLRELAQRVGMDQPIEELVTLLQYADETVAAFDDPKQRLALARTEHVYVPTGGLFAEAVLGRANSAEYLDMERYFDWQDAPIPHQAPAIQPPGTQSRYRQGEVSVHMPEGELQVINPVAFPDPTGLQGVLAAIQNPDLFRDMSKAGELAGVVGGLSTLAGQMGEAAATLTGEAAAQALEAATAIGRAAAQLAQAMADQAAGRAGDAFETMTSRGAALNQAARLDAAREGTTGTAGGDGQAGHGDAGDEVATLLEETFRDIAGLGGHGSPGGNGSSGVSDAFDAPDLTVPGDQVSPWLWRDLIEFRLPEELADALAARDMAPLPLGNAAGALLNLDYFPIHVERLPEVDGQPLTAPQFLEHIRSHLHTNLMIATTLGAFAPYADEDAALWTSETPYGAVLRIDLLGPDNAAVICAEAAEDHWTFHTVATPDTGGHPVSGQRMFGYWSPAPGEYVFYTRGADRATGLFDGIASEQIFGGGAAIWATFQAGVAGFVNSHGGEARVPRAFSGRYSWTAVAGALSARPPVEA